MEVMALLPISRMRKNTQSVKLRMVDESDETDVGRMRTHLRDINTVTRNHVW